MNESIAWLLTETLKNYARDAGLSLVLVGSLGYRNALEHPEVLCECDDIDCILIYDDINRLNGCPYLHDDYLQKVKALLAQNRADMFSTKLTLYGIQISADFISLDYLTKLAKEPITGVDKFRVKATDAIEKGTNTYCNFLGESICYHKPLAVQDGIQLYTLPIHLYKNDLFYPGVLLNKFLYHPILQYSAYEEEAIIEAIQDRVQDACDVLIAQGYTGASVLNTAYRKDDFAIEAKRDRKGDTTMKKNVLVTGCNGFIGNAFIQHTCHKYNIVGIDIAGFPLAEKDQVLRIKADICDFEKMQEIFKTHKIDVVVHTAAEKSLVVCQEQQAQAYQSNFLATKHLSKLAQQYGAKFVFVSSDQVFDGQSGNYKEYDDNSPINYYGELKTMAESFLLKDPRCAICRTALVFGDIPATQQAYFDSIKEQRNLAVQGYIVQQTKHCLAHGLEIVLPADEFVSPTHVKELAKQLDTVIRKDITGIFHCCGKGRISRYEMGLAIAKRYHLSPDSILTEGNVNKLRPKDVSLDCCNSETELGFRFLTFAEALNAHMKGDNQ